MQIGNRHCIGCEKLFDIDISEDLAICRDCMDNNKNQFDISTNSEQFKKEFNRMYYSDTFEHWYVNIKELEWFSKRWNL